MELKKAKNVDETLMLAYMMEMSKTYKCSTVWCIHSKLQAMLRLKSGIDISKYNKLHAFMKSLNKGHEPKKSWVFTDEDLRKFFIDAPDASFLFLKVVTICGIFGSCRRQEMCDLRMSDVKEEGSMLVVNIRPLKTDKGRKFVIVDDDGGIPYVQLFKKYLSLRPSNVNTDRELILSENVPPPLPSLVARFLKLPDPDKYTGHAFRRTSATIMANGGMDIDKLKRQVGWKSSTVAASYIEESITNRTKVSKLIAGMVSGENTSVSVAAKGEINYVSRPSTSHNVTESQKTKSGANQIQISNNENCTLNFYLN
ncbi:hypothetical protein MTP99_002650 [Tenebrio molitor]|nr:hypothetical protein MTP99_002650 [Tenebrio molitor]